ncbi:MAG: tRNA (adenosine(37)-N6)-threonylcarbamoyltransferase complex ATPase subunit type 1 TsaE [Gammaproteobacteria bacterium]
MSEPIEMLLPDEEATRALGEQLAGLVSALPESEKGFLIRLEGELGAGKTTFVRSLIQAMGYGGPVRSPTYTLVEPYEVMGERGPLSVIHMDLYRLADPEELEFLGVRDLLVDADILLVEWPGKGDGVLPPGDLHLRIDYQGNGRFVVISAPSARGRERVLHRL